MNLKVGDAFRSMRSTSLTTKMPVSIDQLCPTHGPHTAQSMVLCGPVQASAVAKASYILTACPSFDNLEFEIFDAGGPQCHFITSVTIAARI